MRANKSYPFRAAGFHPPGTSIGPGMLLTEQAVTQYQDRLKIDWTQLEGLPEGISPFPTHTNLKDQKVGGVGDGETPEADHFLQLEQVTDGGGIVPPGRYLVERSIELERPWAFAPGAVLVPAEGVTVTINGSVDAGLYQWIDESLGGSVVLTNTDREYPEWRGQTGARKSIVGRIGSPEGVALEDETGAEVLRVSGGAAEAPFRDTGGDQVDVETVGQTPLAVNQAIQAAAINLGPRRIRLQPGREYRFSDLMLDLRNNTRVDGRGGEYGYGGAIIVVDEEFSASSNLCYKTLLRGIEIRGVRFRVERQTLNGVLTLNPSVTTGSLGDIEDVLLEDVTFEGYDGSNPNASYLWARKTRRFVANRILALGGSRVFRFTDENEDITVEHLIADGHVRPVVEVVGGSGVYTKDFSGSHWVIKGFDGPWNAVYFTNNADGTLHKNVSLHDVSIAGMFKAYSQGGSGDLFSLKDIANFSGSHLLAEGSGDVGVTFERIHGGVASNITGNRNNAVGITLAGCKQFAIDSWHAYDNRQDHAGNLNRLRPYGGLRVEYGYSAGAQSSDITVGTGQTGNTTAGGGHQDYGVVVFDESSNVKVGAVGNGGNRWGTYYVDPTVATGEVQFTAPVVSPTRYHQRIESRGVWWRSNHPLASLGGEAAVLAEQHTGLSGAHSTGATTITTSGNHSGLNVQPDDHIAVLLDDGSVHHTRQQGIPSASNQLNLRDSLPGPAASGNPVRVAVWGDNRVIGNSAPAATGRRAKFRGQKYLDVTAGEWWEAVSVTGVPADDWKKSSA